LHALGPSSTPPDTWIDMEKALPLLAQRKWYSRLPYGYARGWEPVLYVNNIRAYYDILKWLTAGEETPDNEIIDENLEPPELPQTGEPLETA